MAEGSVLSVDKLALTDPQMSPDKHALITAISTQFKIVEKLMPGETMNRMQAFLREQSQRGIDTRSLVACQMAQMIMGEKYLPQQWGQLKFDLIEQDGKFQAQDRPGIYTGMIQSVYGEAMPSEQNQTGDFSEI